MKKQLRRFLTDQSASAAIEYALVASAITVAIGIVVDTVGIGIVQTLQRVLGVTVSVGND